MKRVAEELERAAQEITPCAVITVPRVEGVDGWAYNEVHFELSKFLDRVRRNEGLATFIERQDADDSMILKIGFTDHEARDAIVREIIGKASKVCARHGIDTIQAGVEDSDVMGSLFDEYKELRRVAYEIDAQDRLDERIWVALQEMGVAPIGPIAGPIRWQAVFFIGPMGATPIS